MKCSVVGNLLLVALVLGSTVLLAGGKAAEEKPLKVHANANRIPAGQMRDGILTLALRAGVGQWRPEGPDGPAITIEALGEVTGPLQVPAPLIRVPEGTVIRATVRNDLSATLRVHGFCARDGTPCPPLEVPASTVRDVHFMAARAGTYHYWATSSGAPLTFRGGPDTQLSGAFVVDPTGSRVNDRVLVITEWTDLTPAQLRDLANATNVDALFRQFDPKHTFLMNGLSWPATERLTYALGERITWRVINLSTQPHPMHLHGFYFDVESLGDGAADRSFTPAQRPHVVTQVLPPGGTLTMSWLAERAGNWLFHCHIVDHVSPHRRLSSISGELHHDAHAAHDRSSGMAAMVLGVTVIDSKNTSAREVIEPPARTIALTMRSMTKPPGDAAYGFVLEGSDRDRASEAASGPGPTLVLRKGEPVDIVLRNELREVTAIHWHGIELDSYYDGVHGWSGIGSQVTPLILPGASFTVRMKPPRAGTFIYHTHLHDDRQLTAGLYGALLVLNENDVFDPVTDHVVVIGRGGKDPNDPVLLNGQRSPHLVWAAGMRHRIRFVNITRDDIFVASLSNAEAPVTWQPISKDGAPVPSEQRAPRSATFSIAVGETFDFEYEAPPGRRGLWINIQTPAGRWEAQGRVVFK